MGLSLSTDFGQGPQQNDEKQCKQLRTSRSCWRIQQGYQWRLQHDELPTCLRQIRGYGRINVNALNTTVIKLSYAWLKVKSYAKQSTCFEKEVKRCNVLSSLLRIQVYIPVNAFLISKEKVSFYINNSNT